MSMQKLKLYGVESGPNSWKVNVVCEELGLPYEVEFVAITELKKQPFTDINPNGRVPALTDPNTGVTVWESCAIMQYLVETYDKEAKLTYTSSPEKWHIMQWLFFQASGQGPYFGQCAWFAMFHPEKLPSAQDRYKNEVKRVVKVLDGALEGRTALVGDKLTYADLSFVMWNTHIGGWIEDWDINQYPNFKRWQESMEARPTVAKVLVEKKEAMERFKKRMAAASAGSK